MGVNTQLKLGLVSMISPEMSSVWGEEMRGRALERLSKARELLQSLGAVVIDPGEPTTSHQLAAQHGRMLHNQGAQVLVMYIAAWSYGSAAVAAARECGVPVVLWSDTQVQWTGGIGAAVCRGSLEEAGLLNSYVYGEMDDPVVRQELEVQILGAAAGTRLRGQTYGLMGSRSLGMYTAAIDANGWMRQFGVEVESWDQLAVVELAKTIPAGDVQRHLQWTRETFGSINVSDEVMDAQIRLYLACKEIIAQQGFDFISVRCLPELPSTFTTLCYAIALLNDTSDADGPKEAVCTACESDSNGALTMQILKHLAGPPALFGDVRSVNLEENQVWISNCGSQPTQFAPTRKDVHWQQHGFKEFHWKIGACTPQYVAKDGAVTLARLTRAAGEYVMLIAQGECILEPREKLKRTYWECAPFAFVRLKADARHFAQSLRSNHIHMVYGEYLPHLLETCRALGIRPIVVS
jgi:L-fucose isomerase